ncbi:hypothetical protein B0H14DRAFT_2569311 [Mycena olivaceomarginata]|nr:hypothetical protein B0H14DRAFT_2569311 [Mycena olivaceomarginata]
MYKYPLPKSQMIRGSNERASTRPSSPISLGDKSSTSLPLPSMAPSKKRKKAASGSESEPPPPPKKARGRPRKNAAAQVELASQPSDLWEWRRSTSCLRAPGTDSSPASDDDLGFSHSYSVRILSVTTSYEY